MSERWRASGPARFLVQYDLPRNPPLYENLAIVLTSVTALAALAWPTARGNLAAGRGWRRYFPVIVTALALSPYFLLRILGYLSVAAALVYLICSVTAFFLGWALPTTSIILWFPVVQWIADREPLFGFALLTCAAVGVVGTWIACLVPAAVVSVQKEKASLLRFFRAWGIVIVTGAFVFSLSTMWVGIVTPGQLQWASIGGLVPFNDAAGYTANTSYQAEKGVWNELSLRRPLAAAFRTSLAFLSGSSYSTMLLLQTCLLSVLLCFAAWAIVRWRGLWAGVAFVGLVYIYARSVAPTTLTEPLGICWALFSVPFLIVALRAQSRDHAMLALAGITIALMTRMGAMFTIPALVIWIFWQFGQSWRQRIWSGIAAMLVVLSIVSTNDALAMIYGNGPADTGGNFAYTLCGLTIGTTWEGCVKRLREEGKEVPKEDLAAAPVLYAMAWKNFKKQPKVLVTRLLSATERFILILPNQLFRGYNEWVVEPSRAIRNFILVVCITGLIFLGLKERNKHEIFFWALLWLSTVGSAAIVYFDDGSRVLAVSYILISLFFALGFTTPAAAVAVNEIGQKNLRLFGIFSFGAVTVLFFSLPWFAYILSPARWPELSQVLAKTSEDVIYGGRRMSGFSGGSRWCVTRNRRADI